MNFINHLILANDVTTDITLENVLSFYYLGQDTQEKRNNFICLSSFANAGTRIIYDRKFLLDCRNSPLARTPPCCLPQIPGVTVPATHSTGKLQDLKEEAEEEEKEVAGKHVNISFVFSLNLGGFTHVSFTKHQACI